MSHTSRVNELAERQYWHPLSFPTYGVEEVLEALDSMCAFRTSMWEKTAQFEKLFAEYQGCADAVMVNSGSSADLLLSFLLRDPTAPLLPVGSEILTPAVTWPTQIWSPLMAGLRPRFVDADPTTLNMDLDHLESLIGPETKAIFVVHLMGNPCDMGRVQDIAARHGLVILEDCCEALGARWGGKRVGNFGLGGAFSFFFSHHITTMEGGMICCPDKETGDRLRILRAHGWRRNVQSQTAPAISEDIDPRYAFVNWGFNVRPTELQAGFGLHQLRRLPELNGNRERLANKFFAFIDETACLSRPAVAPEAEPSWFCLPVIVDKDAPFRRAELTGFLERNGVETRPIVAGNLARQPAAQLFPELRAAENLKGADFIHTNGFYIGLLPMIGDEGVDRLINIIGDFISKAGG